jgi:Ca2+-binding EF-hand superfamily protein
LYVQIEDNNLLVSYKETQILFKTNNDNFAVAFKLYDLRQTGFIEPEEVSMLFHLSRITFGIISLFIY